MFNIYYVNKGAAVATGIETVHALGLVRKKLDESSIDSDIFKEFKSGLKQRTQMSQGNNLSGGGKIFSTVSTDQKMRSEQITGLMNGDIILHVLGHISWNENPMGLDLCVKMVPPELNAKVFTTWQQCE